MPTFEEYQQQIDQEMSPGGGAELSESASDMAEAAQDLQMSSSMDSQQTEQLLRSIKQQQQEISSLTNAVREQASMSGGVAAAASAPRTPSVEGGVMQGADTGPQPTPRWAEAMHEAGDTAKFAGGLAGRKAAATGKQWLGETKHTAQGIWKGARGHKRMYSGGHLGGLETDEGMIGSMYHGTGMGYDPTQAKQYTAGAYNRALGEAGGDSAGRAAMGAASFGLSHLTAKSAGGMIGGSMAAGIPGVGPLAAPIGGALGATAAAPLDKANPISWGMKEAQRGLALSSPVNDQSARFLRGRTGGREGNRFSIGERGEIAKGLRQETNKDLSFSTEDVVNLQKDMQQSGQFLGVQSGKQYTPRFKKAFDNAKSIMKSFHSSAKEASDMMETMYNDLGMNHGQEMAQFSQKMYAGSYTTGLSHDKMMQTARQGAKQASSSGMMANTGAGMAIGSQSTAAQAATHTMPTDLLATVGGERGLGQMLQRSSMKYMQGIGGTELAASGMHRDPVSALSGLSKKFQSGEDVLEFQTNRHRKTQEAVDKYGQSGVLGQQLMKKQSLAERIAPGMDQETVMKSMMGGGPEADAKLKSMKALPEKMRRQMNARARQKSDLRTDHAWERNSISGRMKFGYREFMKDSGGGALADSLIDLKSTTGQGAQAAHGRFTDWISGIKRTNFSAKEVTNTEVPDHVKKQDGQVMGYGGQSTGNIKRMLAGDSDQAAQYKEYIEDATEVSGSGSGDILSHKGPLGSRTMSGIMATGADATVGLATMGGAQAAMGETFTQKANRGWKKHASKKMDRAVAVGHLMNQGKQVDDLSGKKLDSIMSGMSQAEQQRAAKTVTSAAHMRGHSDSGIKKIKDRFGIDHTQGEQSGITSRDDLLKSFSEATGGAVGDGSGFFDYRKQDLAKVARSQDMSNLRSSLRKMVQMRQNGKSSKEVHRSQASDKAKAAYQSLKEQGGKTAEIAQEVVSNLPVTVMDNGRFKVQGVIEAQKKLEALKDRKPEMTGRGLDTGKAGERIRLKSQTDFFNQEGGGYEADRQARKRSGPFRAQMDEGLASLAKAAGRDATGSFNIEDNEAVGSQTMDAMASVKTKELLQSDNERMRQLGGLKKQFYKDGDTATFGDLEGKKRRAKYQQLTRRILMKEGQGGATGPRANIEGGSGDLVGADSTEQMQAVTAEQIAVLKEVKNTLQDLHGGN